MSETAGGLLGVGEAWARSAWRMDNPVRGYDWGSRTALAALQGREPDDRPEAELWMGAHPAAPSALIDGEDPATPLDVIIGADPAGILGQECLDRFGPRLPFLFKVLAIEKALSIQVHPSPEQAASGFAREEAAGIPRNAPHRTYVDGSAKPELLYAVTPCTGLAGMRDPHEMAALLAVLGVPRLGALEAAPGVVSAIATLVAWDVEDRAGLVADVVAAARGVLDATAASAEPAPAARTALEWVLRLAEQHPADPLVLAPLLMPVVRLEPGETMFIPAGVPHAYLDGLGVEIMACSDNTVRAGLTGKHVNATELLALLDPAAAPVIGTPPRPLDRTEVAWRPEAAEFQLTRADIDSEVPGVRLHPIPGPQVVLCLTGAVGVSVAGARVWLGPGESAFVPAGCEPVRVAGAGQIFRAAAHL